MLLHLENVLCEISNTWQSLRNENLSTILQGNILFKVLAEVMEQNIKPWSVLCPQWISDLLFSAYLYDNLFEPAQKTRLGTIFIKCVMDENWGFVQCFGAFVCLPSVKQSLLLNEKLYNKLAAVVTHVAYASYVFWNLADASEEWQFKILSDKQLVSDLLTVDEWEGIFVNLAQHPDAKTLLPPEVLQKACTQTSDYSIRIRTMLSNDYDISKFEISSEWIEAMKLSLESLVQTGQNESLENLLDIVVPIANLSTVESCKEFLGKKVLVSLLKIVTEKLPYGRLTQPFLKRGTQEASRAIWNFSYNKTNREIICAANGPHKLRATLTQTDDEIVKKNIEGILFMLAPSHPATTSVTSYKKHLMISYNWGNQPIVIKLANSLKAHGYSVWLDIERMQGSTLETMAHAIEQADLVLVCMSQKYKDSPNCRLEGEYCVNLKKKFLPLMMQHGYTPDGWLGISLGAKLYYDFTNENNWDNKISELVKAIGDAGKGSTSTIVPLAHSAPQSAVRSVAEWTHDELLLWMAAENVYQQYELLHQNQFSGKTLLELKRICTNHPKVFIQICKEIGITVYGNILDLSVALQKLH